MNESTGSLPGKLEVSRSQVRRWIEQQLVKVSGQAVKASRTLAASEVVEVAGTASTPALSALDPIPGPLVVLRETEELLMIDKPCGMVVHPGAGVRTATLCHRLLHHFPEIGSVGSVDRPGIVHRLDVGTSGVMVVARNQAAYRRLSGAFRDRTVEKRYLAMVYGRIDRGPFTIDAPIGRNPRRRVQMTVREAGRPAVTHVRVLTSAAGISLLEVALETGRTHQIRVHLKHIGHPLLGDPLYGEERWRGLPTRQRGPLRGASRPALHAYRLRVPVESGMVEGRSLPPLDFYSLWHQVTGLTLPIP